MHAMHLLELLFFGNPLCAVSQKPEVPPLDLPATAASSFPPTAAVGSPSRAATKALCSVLSGMREARSAACSATGLAKGCASFAKAVSSAAPKLSPVKKWDMSNEYGSNCFPNSTPVL